MTSKMRIALPTVLVTALVGAAIAVGRFDLARSEPGDPAAPRADQPASEAASPVASATQPALPSGGAPDLSASGAAGRQGPALSEPERLEAEAYPWQEFEAILGRTLDVGERDRLRDLRKEHGLRLADEHGKMERGEITREAFDAWRTAQSQEFRGAVEEVLDASPDEVAQLLAVQLKAPGG